MTRTQKREAEKNGKKMRFKKWVLGALITCFLALMTGIFEVIGSEVGAILSNLFHL